MADDDVYRNPIDNKAYVAPGGWHSYAPQNPPPPKHEKVSLSNVVLLSAQEDFASSVGVDALSGFIRQVQATTSRVMAASHQGSQLMIQFDCTTDGQKIKMAYQGKLEQALMQQLYDALQRQKLVVKSLPVSFQLQFTIAP